MSGRRIFLQRTSVYSEIRLVLSHWRCTASQATCLLSHLSMTDSNEASARDNKFLEMSAPPEHPAQAHESYSLEKKGRHNWKC